MGELVGYIVSSFAWSALGFAGGALTVNTAREVHIIKETVVSHQDDATHRTHTTTAFKRALKSLDGSRVIGIMLLLLALATTATALQGSRRDSQLLSRQVALARCQTAYQNGFADALDARTQSTVDAQEALDRIVFAVAGAQTDKQTTAEARTSFEDALANYVKVRERQRKTQASNPYPPAPREVCSS